MIHEASNIIRLCFVYELHIDQQPVMVYGITVNTHTRTSAAYFEFLRMISFSRTFFSVCQRKKEALSWRVLELDVEDKQTLHTHLKSQCVHLFVRDFPRKLWPLLLCRPLVQLSIIQPEGGERFLKAPHADDKDGVLLYLDLIPRAHQFLCFRLIPH